MSLIPTKHKYKIPKNFSYPIGAEVVSSVLEDFQHYNELKLFFRYKDEYWASKFNKKIQEKGEILVLQFKYCNTLPDFSKEWTIAVYAVPRDKKYIVRNPLISDVLGKAKEWLFNLAMKKHSGYKIFEVFFNLGTEQLIIKHN